MKKTEEIIKRNPRETDKAWAYFQMYLDMGAERSIKKLAAKVGRARQGLEKLSIKHGWVKRIAIWNTHLMQATKEGAEAVARAHGIDWGNRQLKVRETEWELHEECIRTAREAIKRFWERGKGSTLGDVARLLDLASKLGRLASGLATDKTELTGEDGGPVRVEVEAALAKIYGPVGVSSEPVIEVEAKPMLTEKSEVAE